MFKSNYSSQRSSFRSHHPSSHHSPSHQSHRLHLHEKYSTFHVHSSDYEVVFVNNETSTNTMNKLLNHVNTCKQYSIDTESERANNQLSLIQINSIPIETPSRVMLFELKHLPDQHSQKYEKILQMFQLIFRLDNEIYSWGNMHRELEPAKDLIIWPIPAELIDIQPHFSVWYDWARTQCGVQSLSHRNDKNNDNEIIQQHHQQSSCHCHPPSPYKINELWSLQNAFMYGCKLFIDKSCRLSHWSLSLSSSHSSLSHVERMKMIHYATHDVMAVTFLVRPITEQWTFEKIKNRKMNEMLVAFNSIKLPPLSTSKNKKIKNINMQKFATLFRCNDPAAEQISSDDEIYLNQLIEPNDFKNEQDQIEPIDVDYTPVINDDEPTEPIQQREPEPTEQELNGIELIINAENQLEEHHDNEGIKPNEGLEKNPPKRKNKPHRHRERSQAARKRKNKKRTKKLRLHRYRYCVTQPLYFKYPMALVRMVLDEYNIDYVHVKRQEGYLVVGLKNKLIKKQYERQIPEDLFDGRNYQRHYRRQRRTR
ncbi:unnamed protein product [Rotaria sp. Silwood1]|nr:unnamed protein product [Rotaria sp. Silwood1]CAF1154590.1 unnamed protein product [Rotaria sp. Silwood1]CAF3442133.1 unnamed protein product [Rotaria sp. Silwood1]CAF4713584.1 unnamed protein product [Rotaria sp. Silwood1]CAF4791115.1 unnamed protein product [Rotaria sp. Silwood1]